MSWLSFLRPTDKQSQANAQISSPVNVPCLDGVERKKGHVHGRPRRAACLCAMTRGEGWRRGS